MLSVPPPPLPHHHSTSEHTYFMDALQGFSVICGMHELATPRNTDYGYINKNKLSIKKGSSGIDNGLSTKFQ